MIFRRSILVGTVVYLAFAVQSTLSYLVTSKQPEPGRILVETLEKKSGSSESGHSGLRMLSLAVDGHRLAWRSTSQKSGWRYLENEYLGILLYV
jgi:hypothetical protein